MTPETAMNGALLPPAAPFIAPTLTDREQDILTLIAITTGHPTALLGELAWLALLVQSHRIRRHGLVDD